MTTFDEWRSGGSYLDRDGLSVFYRIDGEPAEGGEVLLCLHGFPCSSFDYHKLWPALAGRFRILAFDMIGYGLSAKPIRWGYTTFDQVDVLEELLSRLEIERVHILSHDYGNTITQELLARDAERGLNFSIGSICFLNGALFPETHRPILAQRLLISPLGFMFGRMIPDRIFRASLAKVFGPDTKPTASEAETFLRLFKHNSGKRIAHRLIRYMRERAVYRQRWLEALENMKQPFLFINGSADPVSGSHLVKRFRELIPNQTGIVELPGIGHFPHLESPDRVLDEYLHFRGRIDAKPDKAADAY